MNKFLLVVVVFLVSCVEACFPTTAGEQVYYYPQLDGPTTWADARARILAIITLDFRQVDWWRGLSAAMEAGRQDQSSEG